jgi:hypothetical protein
LVEKKLPNLLKTRLVQTQSNKALYTIITTLEIYYTISVMRREGEGEMEKKSRNSHI